jgi:hypothetical protein
MNMFKPTTAKSPDEYINLIDEPRRSEIKKLHEFIRKTVPQFPPYIEAGMIGYGKYHYKYASGRQGDWALIALASQKNYISVYICASDGKQYVAEKYKAKLPKASIGKSCIRFKKVEDIELPVLRKIILEAASTVTT